MAAMTIRRLLVLVATLGLAQTAAAKDDYLFNDAHFHLTNYIQEGPTIQQFLSIMDDKVGRVALFGFAVAGERGEVHEDVRRLRAVIEGV